MYKSPTNKLMYWEIVNNHWDDISHILNMYLPTFSNKWIDGTILEKPLGEYLEDLRKEQSPRLVRALNAAWWNAPDDMGIWENPSWGKFCDLCSEEWCLLEEREEDVDL